MEFATHLKETSEKIRLEASDMQEKWPIL